jgi:hypothetical protein
MDVLIDTVEDCTDAIIRELSGAFRPKHLCKVKAAVDAKSPARKAILVRMHEAALPFTSNAVIYGVRFLRATEQKTFLALVLGGHFRVYKVSGPWPGEHPKSTVGAHAAYHYVLRATCVVNNEKVLESTP